MRNESFAKVQNRTFDLFIVRQFRGGRNAVLKVLDYYTMHGNTKVNRIKPLFERRNKKKIDQPFLLTQTFIADNISIITC